jgi:hypothetical protein
MTEDPKALLLAATHRTRLDEAIAWLEEGHDIVDQTYSPQRVLGALLDLDSAAGPVGGAIKAVARSAALSDIDPTAVLFATESVTRPTVYRRALDLIAKRSPTSTLQGMTVESLVAAQRDDRHVMETLALIAGLTSKDLRRRLADDAPFSDAWKPSQIKAAWTLIDAIVSGTVPSPVMEATSARPVELLLGEKDKLSGWALVDAMRTGGVSYEMLLTQRAVGSAWNQHRNSTSSKLGINLSDLICRALKKMGVQFLQAKRLGGTVTDQVLQKRSSVGKHAGIMTLDPADHIMWSVIVSVANDSGTASKTAQKLRGAIPKPWSGVAVLLGGAGWGERIADTVELATDVHGHVYTDRHLPALAAAISQPPTCNDQKGNV